MKKLLIIISFCFLTVISFAQVGVGTTSPDASSILDITATDKGVLVPRVSLNNVTTTQLDGVNTAASGLLIWNTNPTTVGGSGVGFYYFDGTLSLWVALDGVSDLDWYEQGTTNAPNAITDNIFTNGAVGINTAAFTSRQLNVSAGDSASQAGYFSNSTSSSGTKTGIRTTVSSNTNATKYGLYNFLGGIGDLGILYGTYNYIYEDGNIGSYGLYNNFTGSGSANINYGVYSNINPTASGNVWGAYNNIINDQAGTKFGIQNTITGSGGGKYGVYNQITTNGTQVSYGTRNRIDDTGTGSVYGSSNFIYGNGSGNKHGVYNDVRAEGTGANYGIFNSVFDTGTGLIHGTHNYIYGSGTGDKYGSYNQIISTAGGTHFGVYSEVLKPGSFAGYFRGDLAIGTTTATSGTPDFYLLPQSRGTINQIIQTNGAGITSWVDTPASVTAENGLTETASVVRLGGVLTQNTTISNGAFDLDINLTNLGDFHIQDAGINHFSVESTGDINFGGDVYWNDTNTTGTTIASLVDSGDDGRFRIYENGATAIDLNANGTSVINEQGFDRDFRIESVDNTLAFGVNGGENVMFAGANTLSLTNSGAAINGTTLEYVASFYRDDLTNGTAIQLGSTEYITDFGNLMIGPYGSWTPYSDNTFDLGTSTFRWDDVYATSGVVNTSDIRLKKNIKDLRYGLSEVMKLEPISYQWKNSRNPSEVKIGFSAQQLLTILPEVVKTHDFVYPNEKEPGVLQKNENLGVYYSDIIPVLVKAIQEQNQEIKILKTELEKKNIIIEKRLKALEKTNN
ncbi:tail fiber domain-containing protein [Psychroserpens sp.]